MHRLLPLAVLLLAGPAPAQDGNAPAEPTGRRESMTDLPLLETIEYPNAETLLNGPPLDWFILADKYVLKTKPIETRPGVLDKIRSEIEGLKKSRPPSRQQQALARWEEKVREASQIRVELPEDITGFRYDMDYKFVSRMLYHEDLCLREVDRLRERRELLPAWNLLEHVRRRDADWPGLRDATNRMLLADAEELTRKGAAERALVVLETLRERDEDFPGLQNRFAEAVRRLANEAVAKEDYRQARHFRRRLLDVYPKDAAVAEIDASLSELAQGLIRRAESAGDPRTASELVRMAARVWPYERGLDRQFQRSVDPYVVIHSGTTRLATPAGSPLLATAASRRHQALTGAALFEPIGVDGDLVRFGSPFIERWQLLDLGRRAVVDFEADPAAGGNQPIDAFQLADVLRSAETNAERYGDRWQGLFAGVRPVSPLRLELTMADSPLRLDALLAGLPLPLRGDFVPADPVPDVFTVRGATGSKRFVLPEEQRTPTRVAEIVEHLFPDAETFARALRRDELDLGVDVPPHVVGRLKSESWFSEEVILGVCGMPLTHMIQFRPDTPVSKNTMLRLGMARALVRGPILEDVYLRADQDPWGPLPGKEYVRLTNSPFPSRSYANDPNLKLREQDVFAAVALGLLAKRQMGDDFRTMRMICPDVPEHRQASERIIEQWLASGFPVELVPAEGSLKAIQEGTWDIAYRVVSLTEPAVDLWPLLALKDYADLDSIEYLPEPLRRRLIEIDRTDDWPTAIDSLHAVHRTMWEQAILIPLWEIDRLAIRRRTIRDAPVRPVTPYQNVRAWVTNPSIPKRED